MAEELASDSRHGAFSGVPAEEAARPWLPATEIFKRLRQLGYAGCLTEAREAGHQMADQTVWRICSANGWSSVFGKNKPYAKARRPVSRPTTIS